MRAYSLITTLLVATTLVFVAPFAAYAADSAAGAKATPDVFLDEGSVDDFAEPTPMAEPALKPPAASTNIAAPSDASAPEPKPQKKTKAAKKADQPKRPKAKTTSAATLDADADATPTATGGKFKATTRNCEMLAEPVEGAQKLTDVASGKKIWTENAGSGWIKVFRKNGAGYLAGECLR